MAEYGQSILDATTKLKGTWTYNGEEYALEVEGISGPDFQLIQEYAQIGVSATEDPENLSDDEISELKEKAENLGDFSWEDDDSPSGFVESVIDAKLIRPKADLETTEVHKLRQLFEGMLETWQESDQVADAKEEMPLDEGNG